MSRSRQDATDPYVQISPNQVVAYNLAEARALRRWTQEEAAAQLEDYIGSRWSKATFSAAERSVDGRRVRQFTADEIVAFSRCFGVPVGFFFMPPRPSQAPQQMLRLKSSENPWAGISLTELLDTIFGAPGEDDVMSTRLRQFLSEVGRSELTDAHSRAAWRAEDALEAVAMKELERFDDWRKSLTELAGQLRSWQNMAKARAVREARAKGTDDG